MHQLPIEAPKLKVDHMVYDVYGPIGQHLSEVHLRERKIVANMLAMLENHGFKVAYVHDGRHLHEVNTIAAAMEWIYSVDTSQVFVQQNYYGIDKSIPSMHGIILVTSTAEMKPLEDGTGVIYSWSHALDDADRFNELMHDFCQTIVEGDYSK